jgi:dTDP-4-amino-4,6-dideoxygalactose transaminase
MKRLGEERLCQRVFGAPLLDVGRSNRPLRDRLLAAIADVLDSGKFLHGPDCRKLEQSIAAMCGVEHAVSCASGSDALLLSLMAIGVGPGDEVITPSFTFFATASAVWRLGARPVFVDIDPATFHLNPQLVDEAITPATKAIIPVHLFGQCAEMDSIRQIAEREGLRVIEDAAQAIGAKHQGRPAGGWGDIGCLSFYPTKNLGGFGDGGMLTTSDAELARKLRLLASHGMEPRYYHSVVGINSRLDSIQAAVLNVKLEHLPTWNVQRRANAERYGEMFATLGLDRDLILPRTASGREHVWNQYTVRVPKGRRDALRACLAEQGIGSETYYPLPLHLQECFRSLGYDEDSLPETERAAREVLSLPIFPELTVAEQQAVVDSIAHFYARRRIQAA